MIPLVQLKLVFSTKIVSIFEGWQDNTQVTLYRYNKDEVPNAGDKVLVSRDGIPIIDFEIPAQ